MKTNHTQAKSLINSAINDIKRALKSIKAKDYADVAFRSQFTVEKLNKGLLCFLGLKFEKTHTPSKIIKCVLKDEKLLKINKNTEDAFNKIIIYSEFFEKQGTTTIYGTLKEDIISFPEDIYNSFEKIKEFIINLKNMLYQYSTLLRDSFNITEEEYDGLKQLKSLLGDIKKWL